MRTTLLGVLLLTSTVCSAQPARTSEATNGSWNYMDLSVETWDARKWVIAGTTEPNAAGQRGPIFKFTDDNLIPIASGAPLPTYRYTYGATNRVLMDFTVDQNAGHVIMTGMEEIGTTSTNRMFITRFNAPNGAIIFSRDLSIPGFTLIPHQIIYSPTNNQYVVVGTKFSGTMTSSNFTTLPKTGFAYIMNATTLATVAFIETNTPSTATSDHDMLETVTERPGAGVGYFAGGSANGFNTITEQNMMVMNFTAAGGPIGSCIVDNTSSRGATSSVMYNPVLGQVVSLNNSSNLGTYELLRFNPATCAPVFPAVRHVLNSCVATGSRNYGFRLQQASGGNLIIVAGYSTSTASGFLTPFQTTTNPGLTTMVNAKAFQTNNTSPLTGYFNEGGALYINTPDMMVYNVTANKTFPVNANSSTGFDILRSSPTATLACEIGCQFTPVSTQWPAVINTVAFSVSTPVISIIDPLLAARVPGDAVLCSSTPLAPMPDDGFTEGMQSPFKLFPNPAIDQLEIASDNIIISLFIYDLNGSLVLSAENEENAGIRIVDISMLKPGAYIVSLKTGNGNEQRGKFVKE